MKTKVQVYFSRNKISGVHNTFSISCEFALIHEVPITESSVNVITRLMCLVPLKRAPLNLAPFPDKYILT